MTRLPIAAALAASFWIAAPLAADPDPVYLTPDLPSVTVPTRTGMAEIARNPDTDAVIEGEFARTSRACPPFCIQPMQPAPGVATIGELELMELLADPEAVVVDSRVDDWFAQGTIPGAVHMPYTQITDRLGELGCEIDFDGWECGGAVTVALFCNGSWCGQSPTAIRAMIAAGYPAERIRYYRGGMQAWQMLGLTVAGGEG